MNKKEKILIADDEKIVRESLFHWFEDEGYSVEIAEDGNSAVELYMNNKFDLELIDLKMPGLSGLEVLKKIKELDKDAVVIMITAFASVPTAIAALKEGAFDYVTKPVDPDELSHLIKKAMEQKALQLENRMLKENIEEIFKPANIIGETQTMKKIYDLMKNVASSDTAVIIKGESGTGKESVAKAIHNGSRRRYFPFISIKCGALTELLLEAELFGLEPNAVAGSEIRRKGKLELADGGSLYLDEVGTISPKIQAELLSTIETKQFTRIGGKEFVKSDFRLITASKDSLEDSVRAGKFREDLFYKMNIYSIELPPLRERKEDILLLADYFIKKFSTIINKPIKPISRTATEFLTGYEWPGNVRELENAIERAVVIGKTEEITVDDLPFCLSSRASFEKDNGDKSLSAIERKYILKVLNDNKWNISRSAQILEIDRVTLYNKINKFKLRSR